jgi:hypothetical protein
LDLVEFFGNRSVFVEMPGADADMTVAAALENDNLTGGWEHRAEGFQYDRMH